MIHKILGRLASVRLFVFATLALASFAASAFDTPYLTFRSASQFRLSGTSSRWSSGTLDIATSNPTDEASWTKGWTGTQVTAVQTDGQYYIYLRGTGITTFGGSSYYGSPFSLSGAMDNVYCEGDIETLRGYNGDVLAMGEYCYRYMFSGWNKLVSAPTLSATTLANYCYQGMFNGCSSLTAPPALPATTLFNSCYSSMFQNCTALKSLPTLPATSSATSCYSSMFDGCESLEVNTEGPGVEWSIPSGFGSAGTMFSNTGGTFTGSPTAGKTYFVASALPFGEIYQVSGSGALGVALVGYSTSIDLSSTVKNGTVPYSPLHVYVFKRDTAAGNGSFGLDTFWNTHDGGKLRVQSFSDRQHKSSCVSLELFPSRIATCNCRDGLRRRKHAKRQLHTIDHGHDNSRPRVVCGFGCA